MVSLFATYYNYFKNRKKFLFSFLFIFLLITILISKDIKLEEDITKAIPFGENGEKYQRVLSEFTFLDRIVFLVSFSRPEEKNDFNLLSAFANDFIEEMKKSGAADLVESYSSEKMDISQKSVYDHFYNNLPLYLEDSDYFELKKKIEEASLKQTVNELYRNMISPAGMISSQYIRKDPLSLTFKGMEQLKTLNPESSFEIIDGHIYGNKRQSLLFFIQPAVMSSDTGNNARLVNEMKRVLVDLEKKYETRVDGRYFGGIPIAVGSAERIKADVIISSLIALFLVLTILMLFFKKFKFIPLVFLPAFFGAIVAVAVAVLIKGTVSAIALGITSVLLGIMVDYSIHTITHIINRKDTGNAIAELSFPLILSCLTTVAAFICLLFLDSPVLNDLGLLASTAVLSAMLFSILILPHIVDIMKLSRVEAENIENEHGIIARISAIEFEKKKFFVLSIFVITAVLYFFSKNAMFEDDLNSINYISPELTIAMEDIDKISSINKKAVYLIFQGNSLNEVLQKRENEENTIRKMTDDGIILSSSDISKVIMSKEKQKEKIDRWNTFWSDERKQLTKNIMISEGSAIGLKENTFSEFFETLDKKFLPVEPEILTKFAPSLFDEWMTKSEKGFMTASLLRIEENKRPEFSAGFNNSEDIFIFDRSEIMQKFVNYLKIDFQTLLNYSMIIVFLLLLLLSGRLELAIASMIPIIFSWIWTLGFMSIFDIKFNIVNIIVVTFIFGLGIDYVAFIMRAKIQEYTFGEKTLAKSYKSSILISCLTTIAGVGALIFAVHPALRSIALIAVIGMLSTLVNAFILAPAIFDWIMIKQKKKKAPPHTFIVFAYTFFAYTNYVIFSLILSSIGFAIFTTWPFKSGKNIRKYVYHFMIRILTRTVILSAPQVSLKKYNPLNEDFKKPCIIISNHSSFLDILMMLSLQTKTVMVTKKWVSSNPIFGKLVQFADFFTTTDGFESMAPKLRKCIDAGYSIVVFPEGTRGDGINLQRFHKGAFYLADALKLDIVPIILHGTGHSIKKGEFSVRGSELSYTILKRIPHDSIEYGTTYQEKCRNISVMFKKEYESVYSKLGTADFFRDRLMKNFVYKGPDIEWYARIKIKLEKNYRFFDELIPRKAKIYDLGCGMGFLTYMLTLTSKERTVKAVDYDGTKIAIAENCYSKNDRTEFIQADLTKTEFENGDVFVLNDVLHYLPVEQQKELIGKCSQKLNKYGMIIIRDGDAGIKEKHGKTETTEKFSTGLGFNQTSGKLNFISKEIIEETAKDNGLTFEILKSQRTTSNRIYLLRKNEELS